MLAQTMKTGKQDAFPINGVRARDDVSDLVGELPLLLDPTRDDPSEHIAFYTGNGQGAGIVYPVASGAMEPTHLPALSESQVVVAERAARAGLSTRGAVSIQVYGLNRLRLVQERAGIVRRLQFLEALLRDLGRIAAGLDKPHLGSHHEVTEAVAGLRHLQGKVLAEMTSMADPRAPFSAIANAYLVEFRRRAR
ncbi:hypothetical protein [Brevundimonas sp. 374]|uniref:hypothetical protein n=1 Tax=Brevundimonas sp. 374 TaxID=1150400 RepID=UPI000B8269E5|nr:hypothetical protein [Brevundimonas sp. 374]